MKPVTLDDLKDLYLPPPDSHKGQNGKLLIIGGSHLFHAASIWALEVASRIVDLVHYSSVPENNEIVMEIKKQFRDGIVVPRSEVDSYIEEDDAILIGPGMTRDEETRALTDGLLKKFPQKQWIIDAGALQMMDLLLIPKNAILTPHHGEFTTLKSRIQNEKLKIDMDNTGIEDQVMVFAQAYHCVVLLKGERDIVCIGEGCDPSKMEGSHPSKTLCRIIEGGNAGMTKGGTGDVLAGLIAALACRNDPFLATIAGSFINKKAGDELYKKVGPFFNASDLAGQMPLTMRQLFI